MRFANSSLFTLCLLVSACVGDSHTDTHDAAAPDLVATSGPGVDLSLGGDLALPNDDLSYTPPPSGDNTAAVTMEDFESLGMVDFVYVTVTLCVPGTATCQTLDHVQIDTGSTGLRVASDALNADMLSGLPMTQLNGKNLAECYAFADGYMFGSVRSADVTIGSKLSSAMGIQVTEDISSVPTECSALSTSVGSIGNSKALGGKAILGIYPGYNPDCGTSCNTASGGDEIYYYNCSGSTCTDVGAPNGVQLPNFVGTLATDNNGFSLEMQPVSDTTGAVSATGTLIFGVNTQANNQLGSATIIQRNNPLSTGPTTTAQIGTTMFGHVVVDSGTNFYALTDTSLQACSASSDYSGAYCPASLQKLTATLTGINNVTKDITITVGNVATLFDDNENSHAFDDIAASSGATSGDIASNELLIGAPYFLGHKVFFGLINNTINGVPGQLYAFP